MSDRFQLRVLTPQKEVFSGVVSEVIAMGHEGEFGVLPGHYPYITSVRPGPLSFADGDDQRVFAVGHGFAQVSAEKVSIVVSSCEAASELDLAAVKEALSAAEGRLVDASAGEREALDAELDQAMALGRLLAVERLGE